MMCVVCVEGGMEVRVRRKQQLPSRKLRVVAPSGRGPAVTNRRCQATELRFAGQQLACRKLTTGSSSINTLDLTSSQYSNSAQVYLEGGILYLDYYTELCTVWAENIVLLA